MSNQEHSKTTGQYHSVRGSMVETLGDLTGKESWSHSGREEHARGEAEYKAAQGEGYVQGVGDKLGGYKDSVVGAVKGDKSQQAYGNAKQEEGDIQQELNKP